MVFSSSIFVFAFLPLILFLVFIGPKHGDKGVAWRNTFLSIGSFIFYAWGEPLWVLPLFFLAWVNYVLGKKIEAAKANNHESLHSVSLYQNFLTSPKQLLFFGLLCNLGLLFVVKYGIWVLNSFLKISIYPSIGFTPDPIVLDGFPLPLGVSFFTFQAASYLIDIYRGDIAAAKRYIDFSCYLTMFSQLVAGPIVRYADIADEITKRADNVSLFYKGVKRFVVGFAKKILVANQLASVADWVFALPSSSLSTDYAWIGIIAFALQVYFDFSAYSDMAIGIGLMFGFRYMENFRHPYGARSMTEFWSRWHISLTSWLRDYLYFPLGGSHKGVFRTYFNILTVFFLCGLWHGASLSFALWGLWYGIFIALERAFLGKALQYIPRVLQHIYVWIIYLFGCVFSHSEDMSKIFDYFKTLFGITPAGLGSVFSFVAENTYYSVLIVMATVISFGKPYRLFRDYYKKVQCASEATQLKVEAAIVGYGFILCILCAMFMLNGSYNPFIYFRF